MKQVFYLFACAALVLAGCNEPFKKAESGVQYKVISNGNGPKIKNGEFMEISFQQVYKGSNKDTILFDTKDYSNQVVMFDSTSIPPLYYKIFSNVAKGDSVVIKQLTDSVMQKGNTPPFMKKGAYIFSYYKVVNIYSTKEAADSAFRAQSELARQKDSLKAIEQIKKDDKAITDYLKKNNIQATKAPAGTYVEIITPGAGNAFDSTTVVKVNYTGKLLDGGKVFDSNVDPQFSHQKPFNVNLGIPSGQPGSVIKGWIDGFSLLKKGAKARFYIPSSLAYGAQGAGADIKANSNLLFDVEVLDVITAAQAKIEEEKEKKEMEAMQQKAMDSMMKAQSKDTVQKAK